MERLTVIDGIGQNELARCFDCCIERSGTNLENCGMCEHWQKVMDKLAAYEDTGLEPEQVKDMVENAETRLLTWFESRYGFPVVRCKDCKHHERDQDACHGKTLHYCKKLQAEVYKDFFCGYGKRKDGDD